MAKTLRLDKLLSNMGYGTRKEIKSVVKKGWVLVNQQVVKDSSQHVDPSQDKIMVNGEELVYREYIYVMMNKPQGVISASFDPRVKTVVDLLPDEYQVYEPFPIGRLDKDTEGLLLLSNDGKLSHELLSPKKHIPKTYFAMIDGNVDEKDVALFSEGVVLEDGYKTLPGQLRILKSGEQSEIELTIYEGKFHQVKRMFLAVGKTVTYLKRISMGNLKLDESLELGDFRELTAEELEILRTR
ncbi:pseudouridine synthase [Geosporobacter ferrireducens]|uniref:Pseudouridine synthase n=1 Tax=Geosporobacter ferrireducens TaxID=1424294 RepID=A0A1D8GN79_9FIRM|nr:pseudouridine synthase [Geosporobacter ferrireducens]AOT72345.1 16S rRNA pseudouridine(516) synthase [Geosporobacter ferrireducens]MTI56400.1 rRNA pseudouridine synthase [Geosporobacter ferrireducens]